MRRILNFQTAKEQVPVFPNSFNIRQNRNDPAEIQRRNTAGNRLTPENTETGQITSFFIRKRRTNRGSDCSLEEKKTKNCGTLDAVDISSSRLVPCCDFFEEKENALEDSTVQVVPNVVLSTPFGIFQILPPELLLAIFDRIPVQQLTQLSLLSKAMNNKIREYISMTDARRRFLAETSLVCDVDFTSINDPFYAWGVLLKACAIPMSFHSGIVFLAKFFKKNKTIKNWFGWGRCFMAFSEGWSYSECDELFREMMRFTGLNNILNRAMARKVKNYSRMEMEVRERFRGFFLSCCEKIEENYGFWNSVILRTQKTIAQQGQLFVIIFGPLKLDEDNCEVIDWELLSNTTIQDRHLCEEIIGRMSFSIHCLTTSENLREYSWTDYHVFNLIEEITTAPHSWTLDNFAALLALRPKLIQIALHARIVHGHQEEAAHLFHAINSVLHQWGIFSSAAVTNALLRTFRALSDVRRRLFLSSFLRTESELLSDALMSEPFDRDYFYMELAVGRAVSPLVTLMASNV